MDTLIQFRIYEKTFRLIMLITIMLVIVSCGSKHLKPFNIQPDVVPGAYQFKGTVNVQFLTILTIPAEKPLERHPYVDRFVLKKTVEETVINNRIFTGLAQKNANFLLEVWVDHQGVKVPSMGWGEFSSNVSSLWRLTRVSDGAMYSCYVKGIGIINSGMAPSTRSLISALQNMILNGLTNLSDQYKAQIPAGTAEGNRPHIEPWITNVRQNWSKLRHGMTLDDVEETIGSVRTSGAILDYLKFKQKIGRSILISDDINFRKWENLTNSGSACSHDFQCRSGIFTLVFIDDRLTSWKLY